MRQDTKHNQGNQSRATTRILSDKPPPHATDLEEVILGSLMLESASEAEHIRTVLDRIQPCYFYEEGHRLVCKAIKQLNVGEKPIDILTVTEQCRQNGDLEKIGGTYAVTMLTSRVTSSANLDFWFRIIYEKYLLREIISIGTNMVDLAFDSAIDCFDLRMAFISELERLYPDSEESARFTAEALAKRMAWEFTNEQVSCPAVTVQNSRIYNLGWKRFDRRVALSPDKIILIAGAAGAGKSKFIRAILFSLLECYPDISVYWISLEDSKEDLLRSYLASKVYVTAKDLKTRQYDISIRTKLKGFISAFQKFDIEFIDQAIKSPQIIEHFKSFCKSRKNRFNILVVDNILSLDDAEDFQRDMNAFYDHVMRNLLKCRQITKGLILAVHHFNDAQQNKDNLKTGYRPVIKDMKGTEAFRRVPNQVLLINSFNIYKDLMSEYMGTEHELLRHLFIVDTGKNREDSISDSDSLIRFFTELAYDRFMEIPLPEQEIPRD